MIEAYPLHWPAGWVRTTKYDRVLGGFKAPLFGKSRDQLFHELDLMGASDIILSTNIPLRKDGIPYATYNAVDDVGVAVYFNWHNKPMCLACDKYKNISSNIRAITLTISALRGIERWGASDMMERAFTGFIALPSNIKNWWDILGIPKNSSPDYIKQTYRILVNIHHPDKGGDNDKFIEIRKAYEESINETNN